MSDMLQLVGFDSVPLSFKLRHDRQAEAYRTLTRAPGRYRSLYCMTYAETNAVTSMLYLRILL
jgi:hypothetical protein